MAIGVGIGGTVFQNLMSLLLESVGLDVGISKASEVFLAELQPIFAQTSVSSRPLEAILRLLSQVRR